MRIKRIKLRDFRGVGFAEVEFDTDGVTIVEGPNETGKTSLADAFDLLLTQKDSAAKRQIKDAKPVGRDVGPFVEAELTLGPYHVVYRKRWLREKMTELEILAPTAEQLSGEDAHSRMLVILEAETDQALFAALRYQQGSEISQAAIADAPSLAAALDAAAGGGEHDPAETGNSDVLLALADRERLRYFTRGGKVITARSSKGEYLETLKDEITATEAAIAALDEASDRLDQISRETLEMEQRLPGLDEKITSGAKVLEEAEAVERRADAARHALELAEAGRRDVEARRDARGILVEAARRATEELAEVMRNIAADEADLEGARSRAERAEVANAAAGEVVHAAEGAAKADRDCLDLLELAYQRDDLQVRQQRLGEADEEIADAERFLDGVRVDKEQVAKLEGLEIEVAVATARAEAGQARLAIEALKPFDLKLDSDRRRIEPGDPAEVVVSGETVAVIDDVARVVFTPAQGDAGVEEELAQTRAELRDLLGAVGVRSVAAARDLLHERSRRESDRDNARRRRQEALKDLEPAELAAKLERADQRLGEQAGEGEPVAPTSAAFEEARERVRLADSRVAEARVEAETAQQRLREAESVLRTLEDRSIAHRTRRDSASAESERTRSELEAARAAVADEELERAVVEAGVGVAAAEEACDQVHAELKQSDPETARITLENDRELKDRLAENLGARRVDAARVREQLRIGGLEGLWDRLAESRAKFDELDREVASEERLAAAAEHLHALLVEKREAAQQAYVGPFAERVNFYTRILFGPNVRVEVDHGFSLSARTLDGTTVPFDWLSGGAREQLAVLARLACAALVSTSEDAGKQRGVPVIIDDALGYSDPERLEKLGAAFAVAGKDCQVIVLTCEPGRYRGIGTATVVSFDRGQEAAPDVAAVSG